MAIKILECCNISPPHGGAAAAEQSLPLVYFDMPWLRMPPNEGVYFYNLKCSETCFLETVVANLKHSLSVTLNHFTPFAGKIIFPLNSAAMPVSRYAAGDGVSLTIAVFDADFSELTGNHPRPADDFHLLVPRMPPPAEYSDSIEFSSIAIQATLFPNQGVCIGFTQHHAVCDARSLIAFVAAWASVNRLNSDGHLVGDLLPHYDRSQVQDAAELTPIAWAEAPPRRPTVTLPPSNPSPLHKLRATFILTDAQIEKLKSFAMIKKPAMGRVSTFVVVCAHLWRCLVNSGEAAATDDEPEYICSLVDCRGRLEPPLPENYFGNCLDLLRVASTHGKLRGDDGFIAAAEAVADAVGKIVKQRRGISDNVKYRNRQMLAEMKGKRVFRMAGGSRMDFYEGDYGWGRAIKFECIHIDHEDGTLILCKGRDEGVEIGLSLPHANMDAFAIMFNKGLDLINTNL